MSSNHRKSLRICRLCLAQTATFFSLTEANEDSSMLDALTSLKILSSDEISTVMCLKCRLNLRLAFSIQQQMLKAADRFECRKLDDQIKQEIEDIPVSEELDIKPENKSEASSDLELHQKTVEIKDKSLEGSKYKCDICGVVKLTKSSFYKHKYNHIQVKCPICGIVKGKSALQKHVKRQHGKVKSEIALHCDLCGKSYPSKASLRLHKYNVHVKLKCSLCGKEITQTNFKRHMQRHTEPHTMCDICGASMKVQDLRTHMFYKHKEHNYKCNFCDKIFQRKRSRAVHENREHLGIAKFICDTCGKKFYRSCDLTKHIQMAHLKLRPYVCDFCKVGFSSRSALQTHRRQHTNETPYRCEICGDGFKQRVSLKTHLRSKHDIKEELTTECKICSKKFAGKAALVSHSRVH